MIRMRAVADRAVHRLYGLKRWIYRGGRPDAIARALNAFWSRTYSAGVLSPDYAMTLEVTGRKSGRPVRLPIAVTEYEHQRYLVSMLGADANWVRNVRAAHGRAVLERRGRQTVHLEEIDATRRSPVLRRYLAIAPGARPHFPIDRRAPLTAFDTIAADYPVFLVHPEP